MVEVMLTVSCPNAVTTEQSAAAETTISRRRQEISCLCKTMLVHEVVASFDEPAVGALIDLFDKNQMNLFYLHTYSKKTNVAL